MRPERERYTPFFSSSGKTGVIESGMFPEMTCQELRDKIAETDRRQGECSCLDFSELEELSQMRHELEEREKNGQC